MNQLIPLTGPIDKNVSSDGSGRLKNATTSRFFLCVSDNHFQYFAGKI